MSPNIFDFSISELKKPAKRIILKKLTLKANYSLLSSVFIGYLKNKSSFVKNKRANNSKIYDQFILILRIQHCPQFIF